MCFKINLPNNNITSASVSNLDKQFWGPNSVVVFVKLLLKTAIKSTCASVWQNKCQKCIKGIMVLGKLVLLIGKKQN